MVSLDEIREIKKQYVDNVLSKEPLKSLSPACGIWHANEHYGLKVNISRLPPRGVSLPLHYMGAAIIYDVVGKITPRESGKQ
jgi:hypothetical protein